MREDKKNTPEPENKKNYKVVIVKNGPYNVSGGLPLQRETIVSNNVGYGVKWEEGKKYPVRENYALCRCGKSGNKPYCDGAHSAAGFDGSETADSADFASQAEIIDGPELTLYDAQTLCAGARFCDRIGGTWNLTKRSDNPRFKSIAVKETAECPSGRLVIKDKQTGEIVEPVLEPSISLVDDPYTQTSGPLWLKGGVPVQSADGALYEIRNRVTLCSCGKSANKPFCDATHVSIKYQDKDGT